MIERDARIRYSNVPLIFVLDLTTMIRYSARHLPLVVVHSYRSVIFRKKSTVIVPERFQSMALYDHKYPTDIEMVVDCLHKKDVTSFPS